MEEFNPGDRITSVQSQLKQQIERLYTASEQQSDIERTNTQIVQLFQQYKALLFDFEQFAEEQDLSEDVVRMKQQLNEFNGQYKILSKEFAAAKLEFKKKTQLKAVQQRRALLGQQQNKNLGSQYSNEQVQQQTTAALRRTREMLKEQVEQSQGQLELLDASEKVIDKTGKEYDTHTDKFQEANIHMKKIKRQNRFEANMIRVLAVLFFVITGWITVKRIRPFIPAERIEWAYGIAKNTTWSTIEKFEIDKWFVDNRRVGGGQPITLGGGYHSEQQQQEPQRQYDQEEAEIHTQEQYVDYDGGSKSSHVQTESLAEDFQQKQIDQDVLQQEIIDNSIQQDMSEILLQDKQVSKDSVEKVIEQVSQESFVADAKDVGIQQEIVDSEELAPFSDLNESLLNMSQSSNLDDQGESEQPSETVSVSTVREIPSEDGIQDIPTIQREEESLVDEQKEVVTDSVEFQEDSTFDTQVQQFQEDDEGGQGNVQSSKEHQEQSTDMDTERTTDLEPEIVSDNDRRDEQSQLGIGHSVDFHEESAETELETVQGEYAEIEQTQYQVTAVEEQSPEQKEQTTTQYPEHNSANQGQEQYVEPGIQDEDENSELDHIKWQEQQTVQDQEQQQSDTSIENEDDEYVDDDDDEVENVVKVDQQELKDESLNVDKEQVEVLEEVEYGIDEELHTSSDVGDQQGVDQQQQPVHEEL
eukprot:TRINITY_DN8608_c0_g4_i2.p1 TRINITY_DN8608_c0_g4~~TRINITY_DN8608_c0_g4_i2.p1  ORF type:complete len:699 (-),score=109.28 TRINITY_DN8608_c0_g4_i2:78-2174(-)